MATTDAIKVLKERGFFSQCTDEAGLIEKLKEPTRFYCGFDPTGPSLHCGHLVPVFAMAHMQRAGHLPVVLVGGGTARIGDPSGKTEMRQMLTIDQIKSNVEEFKKQLGNFITFEDGGAIIADNADWLAPLNYIDFLRDIGRHFSVNRMLTFEAYKKRMETGLSFIEFNYQLLQSYDFLELNRKYNCSLQIGGDDQWGNIVAGMELIRRIERKESFGLTFNLVARSDGKKMGKTEKGAVFLNKEMTSVYDLYQYWRNVDDADVGKFLKLFTFLPVDECERLGALEGAEINAAKEILAFEFTKIIHGEDDAVTAREAARAAFKSGGTADKSGMPSIEYSITQMKEGINIVDLFTETGLCPSKSESRRLVSQNGAAVNDEKINDVNTIINETFITSDNDILLKAGKKRFFRIVIK
ncbi:MAG: tyrosine--tRNA ligase [Spirochaetales bacterium]|nr:tyrosine--tRNA ligase [Spirochaetales bacterium]